MQRRRGSNSFTFAHVKALHAKPAGLRERRQSAWIFWSPFSSQAPKQPVCLCHKDFKTTLSVRINSSNVYFSTIISHLALLSLVFTPWKALVFFSFRSFEAVDGLLRPSLRTRSPSENTSWKVLHKACLSFCTWGRQAWLSHARKAGSSRDIEDYMIYNLNLVFESLCLRRALELRSR